MFKMYRKALNRSPGMTVFVTFFGTLGLIQAGKSYRRSERRAALKAELDELERKAAELAASAKVGKDIGNATQSSNTDARLKGVASVLEQTKGEVSRFVEELFAIPIAHAEDRVVKSHQHETSSSSSSFAEHTVIASPLSSTPSSDDKDDLPLKPTDLDAHKDPTHPAFNPYGRTPMNVVERPPVGTKITHDPIQWLSEFIYNRYDDLRIFLHEYTPSGFQERRRREEALRAREVRKDIKLNEYYQSVYGLNGTSAAAQTQAFLRQDIPLYDYTEYIKEHPNPRIFLDVALPGERKPGRVVIELRSDVLPQTTPHLLALADGFIRDNLYFSYRHTYLHKVVPGVSVHGGDCVTRTGKSGVNAISRERLRSENYTLSHDGMW